MPDHFFVYPEYLSKASTRALGRRVPAQLAAEEVTLDAIVRAATGLGFAAVAEPEKQYPRQFHRYGGRVKVTKRRGVTKTTFLRQLAEAMRGSSPAAPAKD